MEASWEAGSAAAAAVASAAVVDIEARLPGRVGGLVVVAAMAGVAMGLGPRAAVAMAAVAGVAVVMVAVALAVAEMVVALEAARAA